MYKVDGNSLGGGGGCGDGGGAVKMPVVLQEVDPTDGVTTMGDAVEILDRDPEGADGLLVEAPILVYTERGGVYVMGFSSHCCKGGEYDVKYATAPSVRGMFTRGGVLLRRGDVGGRLYLPVGAMVEEGGGGRMIFYADERAGDARARQMWTVGIVVV